MEILNYALRESLLKEEKAKKRHKEKGCCGLPETNQKKSLYWTKLLDQHAMFKIFLLLFILLAVFAWQHNSQVFWGMLNIPRKGKF